MLFNIAPSNAERVKKEFTATRPEHAHGYFKSVILTSKNRFYTYRIDMICGYYILTVRTRDKEQLEIIATFEEYKPGSIAATKGELYKNGSGYPYRIEKSERYLKKYDQLACIVHGAIAAGLLFDMLEEEPTPAPLPESNQATTRPQEAPTTDETTTAGETTTNSEKEPENATSEAARRYTIYTDSSMTGIDSRGAYTTKAEARMRLEKELDEDETSRGGYIFDEKRQKVTAIYNYFNLEKIPEPYRGTPDEYTTRKEKERNRAIWEEIKRREEAAQDGPTRPETVTDDKVCSDSGKAPEEANQDAPTARQEASQEATPATAAGAADRRNHATTCDIMRQDATRRHACENAPERTERGTDNQITTDGRKTAHRATQTAKRHDRKRTTQHRTRGSPQNVLFSP